ncbi:hypothetical protein ACIPSJ_01665 [Streptomyces sp. NPDC090088]|uniref:hypothetical protein n=1 Tax=Streptomyces sp. NPDC090088 TaxID=3365944 RepID=UPI0037F9C759
MSSPEHDRPVTIGTAGLPQIFTELVAERARQDEKFGVQVHPDGTGPTVEIVPGWTAGDLAEAARSMCNLHAHQGILTWRDVFGEEAAEALAESDPVRLRAELIQVAAVVLAWIQSIDLRSGRLPSPATHAERRDQFAKVIFERWNSDRPWAGASADDRIVFGVDADVAIAAADAVAGLFYALPLRRDVYREVADRLDIYAELERVQLAGVTAIPGRVREWADELPTESPQAAASLPASSTVPDGVQEPQS